MAVMARRAYSAFLEIFIRRGAAMHESTGARVCQLVGRVCEADCNTVASGTDAVRGVLLDGVRARGEDGRAVHE
jgi:hypothetical protein